MIGIRPAAIAMRMAAAALLSAVVFAACDRRRSDVEAAAEAALNAAALAERVDAVYDESAGVVRLSGTVDSVDQRARAADVVRATIGGTAQVANEIVVESAAPQSAEALDEHLEERFERLLEANQEIDAGDVDLRVEEGVVTLTGTVPRDADRTRIESLVRGIPGVNHVVNAVTVNGDRPEAAPPDRSR